MKTLSITAAAAGLSSWLSYCSWHRHCISNAVLNELRESAKKSVVCSEQSFESYLEQYCSSSCVKFLTKLRLTTVTVI